MLEQLTDTPFHQLVKKQIFAPLGMNDSGYLLEEVDPQRIVTPYLYLGPLQKNLTQNEGLPLAHYNPYCIYSFWNYPDGLVRSSIKDLAKFATAYMNGGEYNDQRILKASTIEMMHSSQLSEELNEDGDQGLSWFHSSSLDPAWFHGGSDPGISTRMYVDRVNKISVIVFQNANKDNSFYIIRKLYETFTAGMELMKE